MQAPTWGEGAAFPSLPLFFLLINLFFNWRVIALQCCAGFFFSWLPQWLMRDSAGQGRDGTTGQGARNDYVLIQRKDITNFGFGG